MTKRLACAPAPGPWRATPPSSTHCSARWRSGAACAPTCRACCCPATANKTLTCLAGAEPVVGAQHGVVQGLQFDQRLAHTRLRTAA
jgi:hypothetical protein